MSDEQTFWYMVRDWEKHFENSESRKIKSLTWLPVKNKHDGKGYRRVAAHPKSIQVFCAWNLIIQVASKMPVRGVLRDDDGPITASDLSAKTGYPEHIFEEAFRLLSEPKVGWLVKQEARGAGRGARGGEEGKNSDEGRVTGDEVLPGPGNEAEIRGAPEVSGDAGIEQKGREGNRREVKEGESAGAGSLKSVAAVDSAGLLMPPLPSAEPDFPSGDVPTWQEVREFARLDGVPEDTARRFFDHNEGNNLWRNGHGRLVKVRVKLMGWWNRERSEGTPNRGKPGPAAGSGGGRGEPAAPTVWTLTKAKEAKEAQAKALHDRYASEAAMGTTWSSEAKRAEYRQLKAEIRDLVAKIAKAV